MTAGQSVIAVFVLGFVFGVRRDPLRGVGVPVLSPPPFRARDHRAVWVLRRLDPRRCDPES